MMPSHELNLELSAFYNLLRNDKNFSLNGAGERSYTPCIAFWHQKGLMSLEQLGNRKKNPEVS